MDDGDGGLGILLAEPGQGKTYMSRHLVATIPERRPDLVPILVTSKQWDRMLVKDQKSLWKTITHSFRFFDATIGWLEEHEDQFLQEMLKADLFRIVFDGFDEYILRNRGAVQPMDILETLAGIAEETGARIVITSRTSFWRSNLPEESRDYFLENTETVIFRIQPFDLQHAKNYFQKRLNDETSIKKAEKLYKKLEGRNDEFVGRGFVLSLIADAAKNNIDLNVKSEKSSALFWLIEALCRREEKRQELPFTAEQQIDLMRRLAAAIAQEGEDIADTESLMVLMAEARQGLDMLSQKTAVEKFVLHPLLFRHEKSDIWTFTQIQVEMALLADYVINKLSGEEMKVFFSKLRLNAEMIQDLVAMIIDLTIDETNSELNAIKKLSSILGIAIKASRSDMIKRETGLASTLGLGIVDKFRPPKSNSTRTERANLLLKVCGGNRISGLNFSGTIRSFDFRGITFDHCYFEKLTWANCRFDEDTYFNNCEFIGGIPPQYCEGFGKSSFKNLTCDQVATTWIDNERVKEGVKEYTSYDLRNDIHCVVEKFVKKGGIKLAKVRSEDLRRGPISRSPYKDEIMDTLTNHVINRQEFDGSSEYEVREEAVQDIKFFASNNNFTGVLNKSYESLKEDLKLS